MLDNKESLSNLVKLDKEVKSYKSHFSMLKHVLETTGGKCLGFSIAHGVEDLSGKLDLWENMLTAIIDWDNQPDSLQVNIESCNDQKLISIFWNTLNLMLFYQGSLAGTSFAPQKLSQHNIMDYVEIIKDKTLRSVKSHDKVAGYLSVEKLKVLLDEKCIQESLCLFHSNNHTIRIVYKDAKWMLYNSNNKHAPQKTLKVFPDKETLITAIFEILSPSICLERVSFDEKQERINDSFLLKNPLELFDEMGLYIMAEETPGKLREILDLPIKKSDLQRSLANALLRKDEENQTALSNLNYG